MKEHKKQVKKEAKEDAAFKEAFEELLAYHEGQKFPKGKPVVIEPDCACNMCD